MRSALKQSKLEQTRRRKAVDPEHRPRSRGRGRGGHQPDELRAGHVHSPRRSFRFDAREDLVQRGGLVILDVHAHLCVTGERKCESERTYAGKAAARLTHDRGDRARDLDVVRREVDVERDQGTPHADDDAAGARVELGWTEIRRELTCVDPTLQLVWSAAAEEGRPPARRKLSVQEDRQCELLADPLGNASGRDPRALAVLGSQRNDGHHVGGADARMSALVPPQVDPIARARHSAHEGVDERSVLADDRKYGTVVVPVGVNVEHLRVRGERSTQRLDRVGVASLREVRHRLERQLHGRTLGAVKVYYDRRAHEYDEWWLGLGRFDGLDRPHWDDDVRALEQAVIALSPAPTLDVACGTGFLTRHLRGEIVGIDQSERMLELARERVPRGDFVQGDVLAGLPFDDASFGRVFTGHFYGHLEADRRGLFLAEARRVASELVVVDAAVRPDRPREEIQERILNDGSKWTVYKRYFTGAELAAELGGGDVLHESRSFVVVRA